MDKEAMLDRDRIRVDRFLAEVAALMTLRGRVHSLGEDLGKASLREFIEMCQSNGLRVEVSTTQTVWTASIGGV